MRVSVFVDGPSPLELRLPETGANAVVEVKKEILRITGIPPEQQRLYPMCEEGPDQLAVPVQLRLQQRKRNPTLHLSIYLTYTIDQLCLVVDQKDSILDVLFLLAEQTGQPVQEHRLYCHGAMCKTTDSIARLIASGDRITLQFVADDGARRSIPRLLEWDSPTQATVKTAFVQAVAKFPTTRFLGERNGEYAWMTYQDVFQSVVCVGAGLVNLGLKKGDRVGIWSINRPEWLILDFACSTHGFVSVPLYDTLGHTACRYIVDHAEVQCLFFEPSKRTEAEALQKECPNVVSIFSMERSVRPGSMGALANKGKHLLQAREATHMMSDVMDTDLFTICYTSGTTGNPKGVLITHKNISAAMAAMNLKSPPGFRQAGLAMLSYLPLAHIYGRVLELAALKHGNAIGYYSGDVTKLLEDVEALQPTLFPGVPRVWLRVYDRINGQVQESNPIRRLVFQKALQGKLASLAEGNTETTFGDRFVFPKVKAKFGSNLSFISSGSAPLSPLVAQFLQATLQCQFIEGYGLTETCAVSCVTENGSLEFGHVGTPSACVEVKLVDVPDMDYLTTDQPCPRGEVWIRGPSVFQGYYKEPGKTADVLFHDGWFATGDVGMWREDGKLQIIDRKKNIFKLSQGEYIRPEYIENVYKNSSIVANIFVHGESVETYLVAIVVPNEEAVRQWAESKGIAFKTYDELLAIGRTKQFVMDGMKVVEAQAKLRGFERVKKAFLCSQDFSIENDLLTPSFKLKRNVARQRFANEIQQMYAFAPKL